MIHGILEFLFLWDFGFLIFKGGACENLFSFLLILINEKYDA